MFLARPILAAALAAPVAACHGGDAATCPPAAAAQIHTFKPQHVSPISLVHRVVDNLQHDPSGPRPDWVLLDPKGDQVVFVGADDGYQRALKIAQSYDVAPAVPPVRGTALLGSDPFGRPPPFVFAGIKKVDDQHFEVERATVDKAIANPMSIARGARVVPSIKQGAPNGFKMFAIRPGSIFAALGLKNGDTIRAVNGMDLTTPDMALEAYQQVRDATSIDVAITRRGQDLVLHYTIH